MKITLVSINYKSGSTAQCWFEEFKIKHNESKVLEYDYRNYTGKEVKFLGCPMYLGLTDIESIWILDEKEVLS